MCISDLHGLEIFLHKPQMEHAISVIGPHYTLVLYGTGPDTQRPWPNGRQLKCSSAFPRPHK